MLWGGRMKYKLVEIKNPLAVHAIFDSEERAKLFLATTVPQYIKKGYYSDKSLTIKDFKIVKDIKK